MRMKVRSIAGSVALLILQPAIMPLAHAQSAATERREAALDIDRDGKTDSAVLVRNPATSKLDLALYLATDRPANASRSPDIAKEGLGEGLILRFESKGNGSLVLAYGCGGCSNDESTTLTIAYRDGRLIVAGLTVDWDTRNGSGTCDINFLTGKGTLSRNMAKAKQLTGKFTPTSFADWSDAKRRADCKL